MWAKMRRWMKCLAVGAVMAAMTVVGHANSIPAGTYDLTGAVGGYQLAGTMTLNANGIVDAAEIELQDAALGNPVFSQISSAGGPAGYAPAADYAYISDIGVGQLSLEYLTTLDGAGNLDLCILSAHDCNGYQASYIQIYNQSSFGYNPVDLNSGSLDPAPASSPTPEPASLVLLGTAVLGLATLTRRRFRRA